MDKTEASQRIHKLREEIDRLRNKYHKENAPDATDAVYDSLSRELKKLLTKFPEFSDPNAKENRIVDAPLDKFLKVRHEKRMLSIGNVFSKEELLSWEKRNMRLLSKVTQLEYFCELKFDGLAISLIYENGKLIRGVTRGDGEVGEDITQNIKTIKSVPLMLTAPYPERIEVRGEVLMRKSVLIKLNIENEREGKILFANSRNAAVGSLRQLDPKLTAKRELDFSAYSIDQIEGTEWQNYVSTHSGKHQLLSKLGFFVDTHTKICKTPDEVMEFIDTVAKIRETLPFGIDGIVININDTNIFESLGVAGKDPRGVTAFKFPAEKATTLVKDVLINVGRTGVLTPLAVFEPTLVAGSTVSKATLHNMDQIERLDLRVGDTVVIEKAGDVIPKVVEVLTKLRNGKEKKVKIPKVCPVCGTSVEKKTLGTGTSVAYFCPNKTCPAKNERYLEHFVAVFEIYEMGPKILRRFKDEGLITDAADIFTLTKDDIAILPRFGEKSAENIITEIKNKKKISLARFLWALGILHVGEESARDLATYFGTLEKIMKATSEEIGEVENIGPAVSKSLHEFFTDPHNLEFLKKLKHNGVVIQKQDKRKAGAFTGLTFVLTGTLDTLSRELAKEKILNKGGKVSSSVSKNTSFVVAGAEAGSKLGAAQKLGVNVLSEKEFLAML